MNRRRGSVLILVTVIVFAIAFMVLALGKQVRTSALAATNDLAAAKADGAARGAEQYVLSLLTDYRDTLNDLTETDFSAVQVGNAYFWIVRPDYGDNSFNTWGLVDESSKLSLNTATQEQLLGLAGITDEIAGAIIDWRDTDDAVSTNGAESSTYSQYGYGAKNSDFETVDELMLVNGMTRDILYGPPAGQAPAAEATTGSDWYLTHGVADYFTAWSSQPNTAADGTPRISINDHSNPDALRTLLIDKLGNGRGGEIANRWANPRTPQYESKWAFYDSFLVKPDEIDLIDDSLTLDSQATSVKGQININTAPRDVLVALGVLPEQDVDTLLAQRSSAVAENPNGIGWVYDTLKAKTLNLANLVCGRGRQYSADIVAASSDGRAFRHVKIVVDTTSTPPRIVYRRDVTDNGWPLDPQILANLKSGAGVYGTASNSTAGNGTGTAGTGAR